MSGRVHVLIDMSETDKASADFALAQHPPLHSNQRCRILLDFGSIQYQLNTGLVLLIPILISILLNNYGGCSMNLNQNEFSIRLSLFVFGL